MGVPKSFSAARGVDFHIITIYFLLYYIVITISLLYIFLLYYIVITILLLYISCYIILLLLYYYYIFFAILYCYYYIIITYFLLYYIVITILLLLLYVFKNKRSLRSLCEKPPTCGVLSWPALIRKPPKRPGPMFGESGPVDGEILHHRTSPTTW